MIDPKANADSKKSVKAPIAPTEIARYLTQHPDFLVEHPDLLAILTPPRYRRGDNIVDMQHFMVERLKTDLARLESQQAALIATSRSNLSSQQRIHAAVLALLAATSFHHLIQTATTDLAVLLDLDVVTICVESDQAPVRLPVPGLHLLARGTVDAVLGQNRDVLLWDNVAGDAAIFGSGAGLVQSEALLRLAVPTSPPGILALGARRAGTFKPGQGTELLCFLAQTLTVMIAQSLNM